MKTTTLALLAFLLTACCTVPKSPPSLSLPLESMVKVEKIGAGNVLSYGSGFVVGEGLVVTAAHVCVLRTEPREDILVVKTRSGRFYGVAIRVSVEHDLCTIAVPDLPNIPAVRVAETAPVPGQRVLGISAPGGWESLEDGTVHIADGRFLGKWTPPSTSIVVDAYAMSIAPGSSGGMIVDQGGGVVGVILGLTGSRDEITAGPRYSDVVSYLELYQQ